MIIDDIDKLVDFLCKHNKYEDRELLKSFLVRHNEFGTLLYAIDNNNNIIAVCRWNMDGDRSLVLDFAVDEKFRNKGIGKDFILRALERFPMIKYLEFQRGVRGDMRRRTLAIDKILNRNIF